MEGTTGILWLDVIILLILPVFIGPLFLFCKSLWDRYNFKKTEKTRLLYENKVNKLREKLTNFYWPLYVYLLKDYILWATIRYGRLTRAQLLDCEDTVSEESEYSDYNEEEYSRCLFVKSSGKRCNNIVPTLFNLKTRYYCVKHHLETEPTQTFQEFTFDPESNEMIITTPEKIETTLEISDEIIKNMKRKLTENHDKIAEIIEKQIAIVQPDKHTGKLLMRYIHFANVTNTIIEVDDSIDKLDLFNVKYPKKLLPIIERELLIHQEEYNKLLE